MADVILTFHDNKELNVHSYSYDLFGEKLIIKAQVQSLEDSDRIICFLQTCDTSEIHLLAKYPNKERKLDFINYEMTLSFLNTSSHGNYLEVYFEKKKGWL